MKIERHEIFREIEPPPGGAVRLRAKLAASARPMPSILGPLLTCAAAVAVLTFVLLELFRPDAEPVTGSIYASAAFDRLLGRESVPYELTVRRGVELVALRQIESRDPKVRLYRIDPRPVSPAAR